MEIQGQAKHLLLALALPGFVRAAPAESLSVAVAANMMPVMEEIRPGFLAETGVDLVLTPGASGKFVAQIENGSPFDLFVSADMEFPEKLFQDGFAAAKPDRYATGTLILWTLKKMDLSQGLSALKDASIVKIALADPVTAPYGRQAEAALKASGVHDAVSAKLVYGESLGQANQFITTRAADAGFTARSIVETAQWKDKGVWVEVDQALYTPIDQGLVILKHGARNNPKLSRRLRNYILGPKSRAVLKRYGYLLP
ncbi:MAG: molybdate ABC transporter substrate-binding protein [Elusimicrobia bacterium]|nr:molybdate ABC transporter substrate-binding protein [Elusimicrobiota bacterium]